LIIVFETTDTDMNGYLDPSELREAIDTVLQLTLSDTEFKTMVSSMDTRSDGSVTLKSFKKYFKSSKTIKKEVRAGRKAFTTLNIQVTDGPHKGKVIKKYSLTDAFQISIGNNEECDIVLDQDEDISGTHASICWNWDDDDSLTFDDQESTNGSKVNGASVVAGNTTVLSSKDKIEVGKSVLVVVMEKDDEEEEEEEEEKEEEEDPKCSCGGCCSDCCSCSSCGCM